jgi:hypothetical protein
MLMWTYVPIPLIWRSVEPVNVMKVLTDLNETELLCFEAFCSAYGDENLESEGFLFSCFYIYEMSFLQPA